MNASELDQWLSLVHEDALDPHLPIVDPHHHLWDHPGSRYVAEDFLDDCSSGHNIVQSVFVECMSMYRPAGAEELKPVGETEYVCSLADQADRIQQNKTRIAAGIVGYADLTLGDAVGGVMQAHLEHGDGRFRGIRHASSWDASKEVRNSHTNPPKQLLADKNFRAGFAQLASNGLSFDAWLFHTQIPELTALANAFPETVIILDHVGGPLGIGPYSGQRDLILGQWKQSISELARCENVRVKLGGLTMKICGFDWHKQAKPPNSRQLADATAPYFDFCIEQFGVTRCMFESNFPVDKLSCSYGVLWNSFKLLSREFSADERAALFHDTAVQTYRLAPH